MKELLNTLNARKQELALIQPLRPEDAARLWEKFRMEWNYNSNHIEGNTLTYLETKSLLIRELLPTGNHPVREVDEMRAHDLAVQMVREWANDGERELLEADIRDLNRIILVKPFWKEAVTSDGQSVRRPITIGAYKELPNHVQLQDGTLFKYAEPHDVPQKMKGLMEWYHQAASEHHPALVAAQLHYDFVCIHPFDDGNGRVARLLMNYHLLRRGFQPVIIKSADKRNYFAALQRADVGDWEAFARYIGEQMVWSLDLAIQAAKGESIEEAGDWGKQVALLARKVKEQEATYGKKIPTQKEQVADWLTNNFTTLENELKERIGVFETFFEYSTFQIEITSTANNLRNQLFWPYNWQDLSANMVYGNIQDKISLVHDFKVPKFRSEYNKNYSHEISIHFLPDKVELRINPQNPPVQLGYSTLLRQNDLEQIRELADKLYQEIEEAIGS
jgi:Fic family protein